MAVPAARLHAADDARAAAEGHHRDLRLRAGGEDRDDLLVAQRVDDGVRRVGHLARADADHVVVALADRVERALVRVGADALVGRDRAEAREHFVGQPHLGERDVLEGGRRRGGEARHPERFPDEGPDLVVPPAEVERLASETPAVEPQLVAPIAHGSRAWTALARGANGPRRRLD
ncbi:MAG: hypothetical protein R3B82_00585 [Sandaracinaceae bacterium]